MESKRRFISFIDSIIISYVFRLCSSRDRKVRSMAMRGIATVGEYPPDMANKKRRDRNCGSMFKERMVSSICVAVDSMILWVSSTIALILSGDPDWDAMLVDEDVM